MLRHAARAIISGAVVILVTPATSLGQCSRSGLDDGPLQVTVGSLQVDVEYDNGACGSGGDPIPTALAQDCLDALEDSYNLFVGYGFRTPHLTTLPDYNALIYDIPTGRGEAHAGCIRINAPSFECDATDFGIRGTTLHELFHTIQRHYKCDVDDCDTGTLGSTFGQWISEGTARSIEDHLFLDLDLGGSFHTAANAITETFANPGTSLFDLSYSGCLFWSYCCEQMGTVVAEPEYGVDFMVDFWQQVASNGSNDGAAALRDVIADAGRGTLDAVYLDYAICNYTHAFDVSALPHPERYDYVDETQLDGGTAPPAYPLVVRTNVALPSHDDGSIDRYAAAYYVAPVPPGSICQAVGFRGRTTEIFGSLGDDARRLGWAIVGVTADGRATVLAKGRGTEWGRTVIVSPTDPIDRLAAIVVGQRRGGDFEYWFDSGPMSLSIFRPTHDEPALPGPASLGGRFLARVFVDGPVNLKPEGAGTRSVAGLRAEDFTVHVGSEEADVLNALYVGGEYWMAIGAPVQPGGDGFYDLRVSLCDQLVATNADAVLYGNYRVNHMIVIDCSGSMNNPSVNPKIDAAKNAATLYVDAVRGNDRFGIVSFSGNTIPCDNDTDLVEPLDFATDLKRDGARPAIAGLSADWRTSIGDGLWRAQDQHDLFVTDIDIHRMLLLSDGKQNEERFWDTFSVCATDASSRIVPTDTQIDCVALGPGTNQTLMQAIAEETLGDYAYVDVRDTALRAVTDSTVSDLADAFMWSLQRARDMQRLYFTDRHLPAATTQNIFFPVTEAAVYMGTFFVNADQPAANLQVHLYRPDGVEVTPALAHIYSTPTHTVLHVNGTVMKGTWRASVRSAVDTHVIAGLLGWPYQGANVKLAVSQIGTGGVYGQQGTGKFEHGVPVTILAFVNDLTGPVLGANVQVTVTKPDGLESCGPHRLRDDGSQNDGAADDGVYGLIYTDTWLASTGGVDNDDPLNPPSTEERGSYHVSVYALGVTNLAETFRRWAETSFQIYREPSGHDADSLPDPWEVYYGTNPYLADEHLDPDDDDLITQKEFRNGTDPFDPDTDGDGESDGSEVNHGRCPLDPSDGWLPAPEDVEVVMDTADEDRTYLRADTNLLRFPWVSSYEQMLVYRAVHAPAGFALHAILDDNTGSSGNYFDEDVMFGTNYFYRFQAVGAENARTRMSKMVTGTPVLMSGDADGDGDRDSADFAALAECLDGPGLFPDPWPAYGEDCLRVFDEDRDDDIDLADVAGFQRKFTNGG